LVPEEERLGNALHERLLVAGVIDGEVTRNPEPFALGAEEANAHGMEGAHPHPATASTGQTLHALAHLPGRLVGEGHGQDGPRVDAAFTHQVGDSTGEDTGFTRARPREYQQWAVTMGHGLSLLGV